MRERGWVDEVLRTNGDKKDNVDLAKEEAPLPAGKMLLSTLAPVWRISNPPRQAESRRKVEIEIGDGDKDREHAPVKLQNDAPPERSLVNTGYRRVAGWGSCLGI